MNQQQDITVWTITPIGQTAMIGTCKLRVTTRLGNGSYAYFVEQQGQDTSRGEEKSVAQAKATAISLAKRLNVNKKQFRRFTAQEGGMDHATLNYEEFREDSSLTGEPGDRERRIRFSDDAPIGDELSIGDSIYIRVLDS